MIETIVAFVMFLYYALVTMYDAWFVPTGDAIDNEPSMTLEFEKRCEFHRGTMAELAAIAGGCKDEIWTITLHPSNNNNNKEERFALIETFKEHFPGELNVYTDVAPRVTLKVTLVEEGSKLHQYRVLTKSDLLDIIRLSGRCKDVVEVFMDPADTKRLLAGVNGVNIQKVAQ